MRFLARDIEEQEELKAQRQQEEEKAMFSVRKSMKCLFPLNYYVLVC